MPNSLLKPKVSVLLAIKNSEKFIRGCLDSLMAQTIIADTEIITIDGNSSRDEKKIITGYQNKLPIIKYIIAKKPGLYPAWNLGIKSSQGMYLTNLNADDRLKNDALEIMAKALDNNPRIGLVYADSYITPAPNETFENNSSQGECLNPPEYSHKELLKKCICGPHPMWRKTIHSELGYFNESYKLAGDYEFWLRIAEKYPLLCIPKALGLYYRNLNGLSLSTPKKMAKENCRIIRTYFNKA